MQTIKYRFADGTTSEIEVTDEFYTLYAELVQQEKRNHWKETRRHISLEYSILAREMGVAVGEVEKLLDGTAVGEETARRFIYYFGADNAAEYIDWAAIGKQNPFADKGKD